MKVVILGGRSGTSAMLRILRASFPKVWGHTEPPGMADLILANLGKREDIREGLKEFENYELAKCPEFAFCSYQLAEMYRPKFIWLDRPVIERVDSHVNLGWHEDISDKIKASPILQATIQEATGRPVSENALDNDILYFETMDIFNTFLSARYPGDVLRLQYSDFDRIFDHTMNRVARFLNIEPKQKWRQIKSIPHQGGRWQPR